VASTSTTQWRWMLAACVITLCVGNTLAPAAAPTAAAEGGRWLWDAFFKKRPQASEMPTGQAESPPTYASKSPGLGPPDVASDTCVGITIWRLRPSTGTESGIRLLGHTAEGGPGLAWTPQRVEADTQFSSGDRVRVGIETSRPGYLYVIDREQYADGSRGAPQLIFPTTRTRGGDNGVTAGRLIEIPAQQDTPNYFTLKPTRLDQVAEILIILITPKPLRHLPLGPQPLRLSNEQVATWEKTWGIPVERFELVGGAGKTWTQEERAAGADPSRLLRSDDPAPQTLYRVAAKPGAPLLITVRLRL
jgi:hypothetical protein